jgi:hypothetical protein
MKNRPFPLLPFLFFLVLFALPRAEAAEFTDGRIKLVLHEITGRFSLYYMTDVERTQYEPFFVDQDPRSSFLAVMVNDRAYRLGETSTFKIRISNNAANPAIIFESSSLRVSQEFTFIKTAGSALSNGVSMNIRLENTGDQTLSVGLRLLLDTNLGEGQVSGPFATNLRTLESEAIIDAAAWDQWWTSRNERLSLVGSIAGTGGATKPDLIHFANWKRLNDVSWKINYEAGRNFNFLPYSIGDSAVSYYFDPAPLPRGEGRVSSILLAAADLSGVKSTVVETRTVESGQTVLSPGILPENTAGISAGTSASSQEEQRRTDLIILRELIARIDSFIAGNGSVSDDELESMELMITRLKTRYDL